MKAELDILRNKVITEAREKRRSEYFSYSCKTSASICPGYHKWSSNHGSTKHIMNFDELNKTDPQITR